MRRLVAIVIIANSTLAACGGATTFGLRNGITTTGYAVESDSATVTVQTSHGEIRTLNKCEIESVDFPGRGAAITGVVLAGIGAAVLATGLSPRDEDPERSRALVIDSIPLLLAGGGLLGWGATTWTTSSNHIGALPGEPCGSVETPAPGPRPDVMPTDSSTGEPVPFPERASKKRPFEPGGPLTDESETEEPATTEPDTIDTVEPTATDGAAPTGDEPVETTPNETTPTPPEAPSAEPKAPSAEPDAPVAI